MNLVSEEKISAQFNPQLLDEAQAKTWQLLYAVAEKIQPGMTEADALKVYNDLQVQSGAERYWHPPKIRFGINTLKSFRQSSEPDIVLKSNDIFFLDFGPIYNGYEGDAGRTFYIGEDQKNKRVIEVGLSIFSAVRNEFLNNKKSGEDLYLFAESLAREQGFELVGEGANGHRISDFPHAVHYRGPLRGLKTAPSAHRWILEVQLRDIKNQIGSFHEDLLC